MFDVWYKAFEEDVDNYLKTGKNKWKEFYNNMSRSVEEEEREEDLQGKRLERKTWI